MTELWTADIDVTAGLAHELVASQFAQFAEATVEPLGEGWDNAAFLIGGAYVFRLPRRKIAAPLMAREIAVLPLLAPALPIAISVSQFAGTPSDAYPWPFAGYRAFSGQPLSALSLDSAAYRRLASALGAFLRALHAIDPRPALERGLAGDEIGRLDHAVRMPKLDARFAELVQAQLIGDPSSLMAFLDDVAPQGLRPERATIVHGDLYAKHVFAELNGKPNGIIDWGDLHYGDPAIDLSIAFEILPPEARNAFAAAYGGVDDATWRLARYRAIYHAGLVAHYGHRIGNDELLAAGLTGLRYAADA